MVSHPIIVQSTYCQICQLANEEKCSFVGTPGLALEQLNVDRFKSFDVAHTFVHFFHFCAVNYNDDMICQHMSSFKVS